MIDNELESTESASSAFPVIRDVKPSAIINWLHLGLADTRRAGFSSLFYGAFFAAAGWLMHFVFSEAYGLFAGLTTGFLLLGPFLAMGLYDLSRQMELGEQPRLIPSLIAWRPNILNVGIFSGVLVVILLIWARASLVIFALFFEGGLPTFNDVMLSVITFKQPTFTIMYFFVGGLFAAIVFAISVVAVPLMADRKTDAITAAIASIFACLRNPLTMLFWGFCIVVLVGFGFATSFLGLIITMPVVGHATWHAYRDVVEANVLLSN
ncbi:MAG: DUF2189 domain-containing protein [Methylotenera sp.]|nr:DUF2189 domain-containing protein [Methylotenera sp.]MDP2280608.1 DUF2189 domain-containing protein [Methylotenera sp.]MDP3059897.1 DUF2189 domain-containing protein [Methylotenera sp.]